MENPIKLALVDDQKLFLEGLKLVLSTFPEIEVVIEAYSGQGILDQLEITQPDVILLDYTMPEMDGFETLKKIKERYPEVKVIMLTMHYDESLIVLMMQNGANGYLLKDETSSIVKEAIVEVMKVNHYFPGYVSKALLKELQNRKQAPITTPKPRQKGFSQREQEILAIVGKYSRKEISEQLFISVKTVDFHLKNLRDKTESTSTVELVRFAIQHGYQG
ncbi:MAG: response regulator transcription factor [Bacteroidota bacterium]